VLRTGLTAVDDKRPLLDLRRLDFVVSGIVRCMADL